MNKKTTAVTLFRQVCCLGLPSEILMPEIFRLIKAIIPSDGNKFLWVDGQGYVTNAYWEYIVPEAADLFVTRFLPEIERGDSVIKPIRWALQHGKIVGNLRTWFTAEYYASDLYNLVLRPCAQHHGLDGQVRVNNQTVGIMTLFRDQKSPDFDESEVSQFERLLPYVANALTQPPAANLDFADGDRSGLAVLDRAGNMQFCSRKARDLLFLSQNGVVSPTAGISKTLLGPVVQALCSRLTALFEGGEVPPPTTRIRNNWGEFVLRAHWLEPGYADSASMIGVTIEQREPYALRLSRTLRELPLSAKQREVCMLLAQRYSSDQIMRTLNVRRTTFKDHLTKVFDKLDVHSQDELLNYLREHSRRSAPLPA